VAAAAALLGSEPAATFVAAVAGGPGADAAAPAELRAADVGPAGDAAADLLIIMVAAGAEPMSLYQQSAAQDRQARLYRVAAQPHCTLLPSRQALPHAVQTKHALQQGMQRIPAAPPLEFHAVGAAAAAAGWSSCRASWRRWGWSSLDLRRWSPSRQDPRGPSHSACFIIFQFV
jgi:hypothetical protein